MCSAVRGSPGTGTVGILGVCMVLHGIYNLLITADGFWQMVGYFFPSAIIVTLFVARLLHRGRHTVFTDRFPALFRSGKFFELFSNLGERNWRELYYRR